VSPAVKATKGPATSAQMQARIAELGVVIGRFERDLARTEDLEDYRAATVERDLLRARLPIVAEREREAAEAARKPAIEGARVAAAMATREVVFADFVAEAAEHLEALVALAKQAPALEAELERRCAEAARLATAAGLTFTAKPAGDSLRQWVRERIAEKHQASINAAKLPRPAADMLPSIHVWRRGGT
jgi:hypothetical protein